MNKNSEIIENFIEANTKILVKRTPLQIDPPITLTYNPKQFLDAKLSRIAQAKRNGISNQQQ